MVWNSLVKIVYGLEYDFKFSVHVGRAYDLSDLCRDLVVGELIIKLLDIILMTLMGPDACTFFVYLTQQIFFTLIAKQRCHCAEGNEFSHLAHIDAVAIRETYLRGR